VGGFGSPDAYLTPLFRSTSVDNLVGLASPAVDALLAEARASADPGARAVSWGEAERQVLAAAVVVPIAQFRTQVVVSEAVGGLEHALDGTVDWPEVWLADAP
jgi:ABC-type oligopeptide transport system substrate-binding subunit